MGSYPLAGQAKQAKSESADQIRTQAGKAFAGEH
jgi:hypothetical protein